ncbi:MAG TPA: type II CAAX endopeptidase family protein [Blastocatellia bacterium]|nr:type II CAAX endopeptidase family protein [Blastocatellia bacterium]
MAGGEACPRCDVPAASFSQPADYVRPAPIPLEGASYIDAVPAKDTSWGALTGYLVWAASVMLMLGLQLVALIGYGVLVDRTMLVQVAGGKITPAAVVVSLISAFVAQVLTLALCWLIVTRAGKRPFLETLGWGWSPRFRLVHAVGLTILMLGFGYVASKVLPHKQTDLDKILEMGLAVRVVLAILATMGAPIVEEVVYRGVLYSPLERAHGVTAAVAIVTLLFWGVHVPQYLGSWAVLVSVFVLSLALTLVRASTGKLLPCVATHFFFNGVQAVGIIASSPKHAGEPVKAAVMALLQWCGLT